MPELPTIPVSLRVHLAHATLQAIAEECGADVLHIKGPAVDPSLRPSGRSSVDADVLVRPAQLRRFLDALRRFGWQEVTRLTSGGIVEHSTNWYHSELGQVDVHLRFPGIQIEPARAFDRLWEGRGSQDIANRPCTVPSLEVQRLILLLHAARGGREADAQMAWTNASDTERNRVSALAIDLEATVAFAAATGRLEDFSDCREFALWRLYGEGADSLTGFLVLPAAAKAAPAGYTFIPLHMSQFVISYLLRLPQRLALQLSRRPTLTEICRGYSRSLRRALYSIRTTNH